MHLQEKEEMNIGNNGLSFLSENPTSLEILTIQNETRSAKESISAPNEDDIPNRRANFPSIESKIDPIIML